MELYQQGILEEMALGMQEIAQYWEQLFLTTGGALALDKCFYVAMEWSFKKDVYSLNPPNVDVNISLSSGNIPDKETKIRQVATSLGTASLEYGLLLTETTPKS